MEQLNGYRMRMVLVGVAAAIVLGGGTVNADFVFGEPTNLGPTVNSAYSDRDPSISADGLQLYFTDWSNPRPGGYGSTDIWVTTRPTKDDPWGTPVNLGSTVNSSYDDLTPSISADGLSLYFGSDRPGGYGDRDIWVTTRTTTGDPWGEPVNLGPIVNSSGADRGPSISADGLSLFLHSERSGGVGGQDIWVTTRTTPLTLGPSR